MRRALVIVAEQIKTRGANDDAEVIGFAFSFSITAVPHTRHANLTQLRNKFSCLALLNALVNERPIISGPSNSTSPLSFRPNYGDRK
jgi:hypothetical protein